MSEREGAGERLTPWAEALSAELGLAGLPADVDSILALAGRIAHAVERPAAPLSTFLVGFAAGAASREGAPSEAAVREAIDAALRFARPGESS